MRFRDIPRMPFASYNINVGWKYLPEWLKDHAESKLYSLELEPEFQRGHVWTAEQRTKYLEFIIRGGFSGKNIFWNCPGWMDTYKGPLQLVDGLQRITSVLKFLNNEVKAFGHFYEEFEDRLPEGCQFVFHINNLKTQADVIRWYLDLNEGGVVHTPEEIVRVKNLLNKEFDSEGK